MDRTVNRVLILTLGTGGYISTQYEIDGEPYKRNGKEAKANFLAEPLINSFKPDEIVFLGTVKSRWNELFTSLIDHEDNSSPEESDIKRLEEIYADGKIDTEDQKLKEYGEEITEIFGRFSSWDKLFPCYKEKKPGVHILLTKYGRNKEELKENYRILKGIEAYLKSGIKNYVAFDVTHSFRSLPIYNLIIFNYIRNITNYEVLIEHVYYGMYEVKHEIGRAPIVDLIDVVKVLNLTNSVAEFKDTGNAGSLVEMLDNNGPNGQIRRTLEKFDLATQINAFDKIKEELIELCKQCSEIQSEASNEIYTGVREMINTVLRERFLGTDTIDINQINSINDADLKFLLTKWFFNQNRMGLGLATGLEALRDINTPAFILARPSLDPSNQRKYRESAESYFIDEIAESIRKRNADKTALEEAVMDLGTNLRRYKTIRDMFAHSLNSNSDDKDLHSMKAEIEEFSDRLFRLKELYDCNSETYYKLFIKIKNDNQTRLISSNDCRVIIPFAGKCDYRAFMNSNKKSYDVLHLSAKAKGEFFGDFKEKKYPAAERAFFLCKYLKKWLPDNYDQTQIILWGCTDKSREAIFRIFLENFFNDSIKSGKLTLFQCESAKNVLMPLVKTRVLVSIENQQGEYNKDIELEYEKNVMDYPLVKATR